MKSKKSIVFFGTPRFAAEVLRFLIRHETPIAAVVTQPDRPKGRSLELLPSDVKQVAIEELAGVPILQPIKASEPPFLDCLAKLQADLFVVVAYGQILPQTLLSIPPLGCINVHASLLPQYRGAAPIQRSLMAGEVKTGVAIQKMVKQLDAGDVIACVEVPIFPETTFGELENALCNASKPLLIDVLQRFERGVPPATPQNHELATYAPKVELEEGEIDWKAPAEQIHNKIRAFSPKPGAWCWIEPNVRRLKILKSRCIDQQGKPGQILSRDGAIACGRGALILLEVQPEGKKRMSGADWLRGAPQVERLSIQ